MARILGCLLLKLLNKAFLWPPQLAPAGSLIYLKFHLVCSIFNLFYSISLLNVYSILSFKSNAKHLGPLDCPKHFLRYSAPGPDSSFGKPCLHVFPNLNSVVLKISHLLIMINLHYFLSWPVAYIVHLPIAFIF